MPTYARYKANGEYLRGTLWTCSEDNATPPETHAEDFAIAFGIPAEEIECEVIAWDGRDETLPFADDNSAPVERIPEEQREGYVKPEPQPPTPLEIVANAILADAGTSSALKDAARAAIVAGGEVVSDKIVPMVPQQKG